MRAIENLCSNLNNKLQLQSKINKGFDVSEKNHDVAEKNHKLRIVFIINGVDFSIDANVNAPLMEAVQQALAESKNTGREPDEWEVRDASGVLLEKNRTPKDLGLSEGVRLFLSLRVGAGGVDQSRPRG